MTKLTIAVDPESIMIPKKPANKSASEHRKITKPIMEKKRRARINKSLEQIKDILKENYYECSKKNQLEKADILELTVKYLNMVHKNQIIKQQQQQQQQQQRTLIESNNNNVQNVRNLQLIQTGFDDCRQKVGQCLSKFNPKIHQRLNAHLAKFERQHYESVDCDEVLNLSLSDHMVMNNSFMLHTPNSASSTSSQSHFTFPSTPNSERSMSPIELTMNHQQSLWRPW